MSEWQESKVARLEMWEGIPNAVGWEMNRTCGCRAYEGMRLDLKEPTFLAMSCDEHGLAGDRAMHRMKTMPPSFEPVWKLWERLLDEEITHPSYDD